MADGVGLDETMSDNACITSGQRNSTAAGTARDHKTNDHSSEVTSGSVASPVTASNTPPVVPQGRSAASGNTSKTPKTFEFVLVTDSESRRQVRRHAMRQYVHQRRLDGIARLESTRVPVSGWVKGKLPSESKVVPKVEELDDDKSSLQRASNTSREDPSAVIQIKGRRYACPNSPCSGCNSSTQVFPPTVSDPKLSPSASASDPFNSYPIKVNETDNNLIFHFVNTYPQMMYQMDDPHQENPIRTIFHQLALHNVVSFQAMLAIAAKHLAGVEGRTDTVLSLTHKMRALRLINEHLQSGSSDKHDGILYAVASMAVIEKWSKDGNVERMHFQGVRHLIRRRSGMRGLRSTSQFMENVLYWVDFSCAPKAIFDASLPWTGSIPDTPPRSLPFLAPPLHFPLDFKFPIDVNHDDALGIMQACEDFLSFFRSLNELQYSLLSQTPPPVYRGTSHEKPELFGPSVPLYVVLTTLRDYDHGIKNVRFIDEYTSMACLLYLGVALHDCYFMSRNFNSYLEWVNSKLRGSSSRQNFGVTTLLWIFLNNGGFPADQTPDHGERSWFVSRMLRVAKRLEWTQSGVIWDGLRSILVNFIITQQQCELGSDHISEVALAAREKKLQSPTCILWDEAEMRQSILGPLYWGPPVFLPSNKWEYPMDVSPEAASNGAQL